METNYGSIPDIVVTNFVERDGIIFHGSSLRSWTLELFPNANHPLAKHHPTKSIWATFKLDINILPTEGERYMAALNKAEENWIQYWLFVIEEHKKDNFILGGAL